MHSFRIIFNLHPLTPCHEILLLVERSKDLGLELVGDADASSAVGAGLGGGLLLVVDRLVRVASAAAAAVVVLVLGRGAVGLLGDEVLVGARGGRRACVANVAGTCDLHTVSR